MADLELADPAAELPVTLVAGAELINGTEDARLVIKIIEMKARPRYGDTLPIFTSMAARIGADLRFAPDSRASSQPSTLLQVRGRQR